jgi:hypothetical protein
MITYASSIIYLKSKRNKQCSMFCGGENPFCITSGLCITRSVIVWLRGDTMLDQVTCFDRRRNFALQLTLYNRSHDIRYLVESLRFTTSPPFSFMTGLTDLSALLQNDGTGHPGKIEATAVFRPHRRFTEGLCCSSVSHVLWIMDYGLTYLMSAAVCSHYIRDKPQLERAN